MKVLINVYIRRVLFRCVMCINFEDIFNLLFLIKFLIYVNVIEFKYYLFLFILFVI